MDSTTIANFMMSGDYYLIAAAMTYLASLAIIRLTPDTMFTSVWGKRLLAGVIAVLTPVLPALSAGLIAHLPLSKLAGIALAAFFGSTLAHKLMNAASTAVNVSSPPKPQAGDVLVVTDAPKDEKPIARLGLRMRAAALAFGFAVLCLPLTGCGAAALNAPIVAVNTSEKTLTEANTTLAQIESRQLTDAINAASDAAAAHAAKDTIAKKFHGAWDAYDKVRASWTIAKIAVVEYESVEASGGITDLPKVLAATAQLASDYKALVAALKEIAQ